jgi:hypothetical protein
VEAVTERMKSSYMAFLLSIRGFLLQNASFFADQTKGGVFANCKHLGGEHVHEYHVCSARDAVDDCVSNDS